MVWILLEGYVLDSSPASLSSACLLWAGADDFLPLLIFTVIHANPPNLASNLEYIQRFRYQSRMISESAYFYTQLVGSLLLRSMGGNEGAPLTSN